MTRVPRSRPLLHAALLAVLTATVACQGPAPAGPGAGGGESVPVALNPPPVPSPSPAAASATPTPSALASLPEEQRQALGEGLRALAAGDSDRAVARLEPVVADASGDAQAEARLLLGQAQVGARSFEAALATAQQVGAATQQPELVSAARLLAGQALRGLQRWDEAAAEMRAAAETNPLVEAAVRLELAEMWLGAGQPDPAAEDARKGLETAQPRLLNIELAERLGKAEVQRQDPEAAMDAYRQLLTAAGSRGYLGEQLYNLAEGASALGREEDAVRALRTSIAEFPRSRKAPEAVQLLEELGGMRPEDRFFAGLVRYYFWNFRGARADFDAYLAALPDGDGAIEARYYRALSSPPRDTTAQLLALAQEHPDDDFAPLALLEAGRAQEELADYCAAEEIYARLVEAYPTRDAGVAGAFRRGLARLMRGDPAGALAAWDELLGRGPEPAPRAQALYWSGKALAAQGDAPGARAKWEAAAAVRPVDYYVVRARVELDSPPDSDGFDPARIGPADEAALARWFAERNVDLDRAARVAGSEPAYQRAVALVRHGLYRQASWEHEGLLTRFADKPAHLYWLAARFGELGLPNAELQLGSAALRAATAEGQVSVLDVPPALQRVAFPLAFPELVAPIARRRGLDPLLFNALMRQESDFDPYAESVARARGLTQIIPKTGDEIAAALGVGDFTPESLFQPRRSVEFGAWYFGQRVKRNGGAVRALASYNAGDGNVDNWTGPGRDDPDVFAEYIPFAETHDYVKKIYTYWMLQRYIWGS